MINAIKNNEFFLVFQPQYELMTRQIIGMEVLIRWKNTELGMVYPDEFIPLLETSDRIQETGLWVIQAAFKQYMQVHADLPPNFKLAINLSSNQLTNPQLDAHIHKLILEYQIDPNILEFEVTETSMMNTNEAASVLSRIREWGSTISIDDFGTGYSSLSRLQDLPVDILKIDKSFVMSLDERDESQLIIENTLRLANKLHLNVIAEGIETEEQLLFLIKHECKYGQGYLLNKPMSLDELIQQIKNK